MMVSLESNFHILHNIASTTMAPSCYCHASRMSNKLSYLTGSARCCM